MTESGNLNKLEISPEAAGDGVGMLNTPKARPDAAPKAFSSDLISQSQLVEAQTMPQATTFKMQTSSIL